jgi:peptidoglycan/LPS O-acetylase OafA/YrhL
MLPKNDQGATRVQLLDVLRLVAVAAVVVYHFGFWGPAAHGVTQVAIPSLVSFAQYGFLGVPVFFIISGFVIAYSAEGRTATGFAIARFSRIYPTFVVCMTLTFLTILALGKPHYDATFVQWLANLSIMATVFGEQYMDTSYWSLVIEVVFYAWVAALMAVGVFPRRIDTIILIWLGITLANELTVDLPIIEKLFMADDSGFFAVGLLIYEFYRGRRDAMLYGLTALSTGTAVFQALHKLERLGVHGGGDFDNRIVVAICLLSIAIIFLATRIKKLPLPPGLVIAIGGLTYPFYLLHMQMGYVIYSSDVVSGKTPVYVAAIVFGIAALSWAIWRYVEKPLQRRTREILTICAVRAGLPPKPGIAPESNTA